MRKSILLITMMIMALCVSNTQAQDRKAERAAKHEQQQKAINDRFIDVIEGKEFRFVVSSINADVAPQLAYIQLRGGYMITVKDGELTIMLPFSGPNVRRGNSPTYNVLSFTTADYKVALTPNGEDGLDATIVTKDPQTNYSYTFVINNSRSRDGLTVFAMGMDKVSYFGGIADLRH